MAGLLAWAADVVGGSGQNNVGDDDDEYAIPIIFTPDQQRYARELDQKAASLSRSIQDLRIRIPPADIAQRLPHLHAHSLASNADLALQLNSHSSTREQTQLREVTLQEENAEYEKAISNCENKMQEKLQEADVFRKTLEEMELTEQNIRVELENAQIAMHSGQSDESLVELKATGEALVDTDASQYDIRDKLEDKKEELRSMEETVQDLDKKWAQVQDNALKQPSPAQREKILDKQLHSLIEQLESKQAQAEGLVSEVHSKEVELERLNGLARRLDTISIVDVNMTRNRIGRSNSNQGSGSADYIVDAHQKPPFYIGSRAERLMLLRSAFVLYILALHILVFIKISF